MADKFDKETSNQNFEWHRERALREKKNPNSASANRIDYNLKAIEKKHGAEAAREVLREVNSKDKSRGRKYFT
jgi:hypothetical protein